MSTECESCPTCHTQPRDLGQPTQRTSHWRNWKRQNRNHFTYNWTPRFSKILYFCVGFLWFLLCSSKFVPWLPWKETRQDFSLKISVSYNCGFVWNQLLYFSAQPDEYPGEMGTIPGRQSCFQVECVVLCLLLPWPYFGWKDHVTASSFPCPPLTASLL